MRPQSALLFLPLALVMAACGSGGDSADPSRSTSPSSTSPSSSTTTTVVELTEVEQIAAQGQECVSAAFDRACYEAVAAEWMIATDDTGDDMPTVRCFAHGAAARLSTADLQTYVEDNIVGGGLHSSDILFAIARAKTNTYFDEKCGD